MTRSKAKSALAPSLYQRYLERAIIQHGSIAAVEERLPQALSHKALTAIKDDRYLAEMTACVFRAGFVWRIIQLKWDGFETVFNHFLPIWVASRSPEEIEDMASDTRIVRNLTKVKSAQENALFVLDIQREFGSFVDKTQISSQRDLAAVQKAFNDMRAESGRSLCELSMILALSIGPA